MVIIVTGAAGFIGFHVSLALLKQGHTIIGIDNLNAYYDVKLKQDRLASLTSFSDFIFYHQDISDSKEIEIIARTHPETTQVVHLAAQAGVRYSVEHPFAYLQSNLVGHMVILEMCRHLPNIKHLVYASSSSVYGNNNNVPFSTDAIVNTPRSLYAATKQCNEVLTYSYSYLYHIPATGLRFFTVYGPWGRPDMAVYSFTKAIVNGTPIHLFNHGAMQRDFTYIDDIVSGIIQALNHPPLTSPPHTVYNLGNHKPVSLETFVDTLETIIGKKAIREYHPMHPGDMIETYADITDTQTHLRFFPSTPLKTGLGVFFNWYKHYHL